MHRKPISAMVLVCAIFAPIILETSLANADIIASFSRHDWMGHYPSSSFPSEVAFWLDSQSFGSGGVGRGHYFNISNAGDSFDFTPANTTGFDALASMLTNGLDDKLYDGFMLKGVGGPGGYRKESEWGLGNPDLHGYDLTEIRVTLDTASVSPYMTGWYFDANFTWDFIGSPVPEPATLGLLALGGLGLIRRRQK